MIKAADPPTLRDIAQVVGVTPTTVSLALRDNPRISPPTRRKIRQTAEHMGYRPNAELSRMMASLKSRHNRDARPVIALVTGMETRSRDGAVRAVFQGIAETAGYSLDVIDASVEGMGLDRIAGVLKARGIRAGVLYRVEAEAPKAKDWMDGLALCCVGPPPPGTRIASCQWAEPAGEERCDEPLLQAAMDLLDLAIQRNRYGEAGHGMTLQIH